MGSAPHKSFEQQTPDKPHGLMNTAQAADFLGVSESFLERDRWAGPTIPFVLVGRRGVRYRVGDLTAYVEQNLKA